jgi:hypothetical protein
MQLVGGTREGPRRAGQGGVRSLVHVQRAEAAGEVRIAGWQVGLGMLLAEPGDPDGARGAYKWAIDSGAGGYVDSARHHANEGRPYSSSWPTRCSGDSAQQPRSNSALRTHTNHHPPALFLWCNALLREGSWWAVWWGSPDGMQGVRGSNPLSSTPGQRPSPPPTARESRPAQQIRSNCQCVADAVVQGGGHPGHQRRGRLPVDATHRTAAAPHRPGPLSCRRCPEIVSWPVLSQRGEGGPSGAPPE